MPHASTLAKSFVNGVIDMRKTILMIAAVAAAMAAAMATAGAASAQTGNFLISNNSTTTVNLTANSFANTTTQPTLTILAGGTGTGQVQASSYASTWGGTIIYTNDAGIGCSFTSYAFWNNSTGKYTFSFTSAKQGGAASTAVCGHTADRSPSGGGWTSYVTMSGF